MVSHRIAQSASALAVRDSPATGNYKASRSMSVEAAAIRAGWHTSRSRRPADLQGGSMKRFVLAGLAVLMGLSLAACAGKEPFPIGKGKGKGPPPPPPPIVRK